MRALVVEALQEVIEPRLLLQEVPRCRLGRLLLQRQMHALVPAILLRMARADALDRDPQPQPPHVYIATRPVPLAWETLVLKPKLVDPRERLLRHRANQWCFPAPLHLIKLRHPCSEQP
jgi:hypothetical protein